MLCECRTVSAELCQEETGDTHAIVPDEPPTRMMEDEAERERAEMPSSTGKQSG